MTAPRDDRPMEFNSPEWEDEKQRRRGNPHGAHVRPSDADEPMKASAYARNGDVSDLADAIINKLNGGTGPAVSKPKLDLTLNVPTIMALVGMLLAGLQGWNNLSERVAGAERGVQDEKDRAQKYVPIIERLTAAAQTQIGDNQMQNDRIQAQGVAIGDERRARQEDTADGRKMSASLMASVDRLASKVADIDKAVAVMQGPGRRTEVVPPERDASLPSPNRPR